MSVLLQKYLICIFWEYCYSNIIPLWQMVLLQWNLFCCFAVQGIIYNKKIHTFFIFNSKMLRVTNCYFCIFCFHQKYFAKCVTQSINNDNLNFSTYFSRRFPTLKIQKICNFLVLAMSRKVTFLMYPFICWKLYHLFLMELIFQYEKIKCFAF